MLFLRFFLALALAYFAGRLAKKLKFPPIIGWLLMAMFLGPHGWKLLDEPLTSHPLYTTFFGISQLALGSMVGYTLVYRSLKEKIKSVLAISLADALVTFLLVTGVFALLLHRMQLPLIGAVLFGVIAMTTAPAPPVGLIQQYRCRGPLSDTVAPMTAINSVLTNAIFFPVVAIISALSSDAQGSILLDIAIVVLAPIGLGLVAGLAASRLVGEKSSRRQVDASYIAFFFLLFFLASFLNQKVFSSAQMMTILAGIAYAAAFVNGIPASQVGRFQKDFLPIHNALFLFFIVHLSKDLNPFGLLDGGVTMLLYVISRGLGKYSGSFLGAKLSHADEKVTRGIGLVMQPHSGVSIMFSGISAHALAPLSPELAGLLHVSISAAALVIELISMPLSKLVYEKYGEIPTTTL